LVNDHPYQRQADEQSNYGKYPFQNQVLTAPKIIAFDQQGQPRKNTFPRLIAVPRSGYAVFFNGLLAPRCSQPVSLVQQPVLIFKKDFILKHD